MNNKGFLSQLCLLAIAVLFITSSCAQDKETDNEDPWNLAEQIKAQITVPQFPDTTFSIVDYGAVEGGEVKNTDAFRKVIAAANEAGGGKVLVPKGQPSMEL